MKTGDRNQKMSGGRLLRLTAIVFAALFLLAGGPSLLAQVNTGTIEAFVTDRAGEALPGVTVLATDEATGFARQAISGTSGVARLVSLPPGTYSVKFSLEGYATTVERGIVVYLGQTIRVRIGLTDAITETVTVTATAPLVDVYKTDGSTNIIPEQIEMLPVADREFEKLAFIAPGVQRERGEFRFIQGGPVVGSGGNASQASIMVDGVDLTDPVLGLARARFSQDAIREFRVINNRFDPEIGRSAGGALSIVTKSGTNDFSGSVFGFYRADSLRSEGELEQGTQDFSRFQGGITVGGPIVEDRTHYFVSFEQISNDDITLFRPGGAFASLARDYPNEFDQTLALVSIDHRINDDQTLGAKAVYERYREDNFRVGGIQDLSYGQSLERDNYNFTLQHNWALSGSVVNDLRLQIGRRKYFEPTNSDERTTWYSSGTSLRTGANIVGDLLGDGDIYELRDTLHWTLDSSVGVHNMKAGFTYQHVKEFFHFDVFENGLLIQVLDNDFLPLAYSFGIGSSDTTIENDLFGFFINDDWQITPNFVLSLGLRYDLDTDGNNPDFRHSLVPDGRERDDDNWQPRVAFTWDTNGDGSSVFRGGWGVFTGRYLLVPAFSELQQNGESGRLLRTNLNGALIGLPAFTLDPNDPENTGLPLPPDITLLDTRFDLPESRQLSFGWTRRLGESNLYLDIEQVWVKGEDEIVVRDTNFGGNEMPIRLNPIYNQINTYTNEGRSYYYATTLSVNGMIRGGHILTGSLVLASKRNTADDFSPAFPTGYPNDPADIGAEYGRSRADEKTRLVLSGVFKLPWGLTLSPIFEYGSGQPWNRRLGYDFNGDGKNSDRAEGVERNSQNGPSFQQLSVRLTKSFPLGDGQRVEFIVEAFNLLNRTNYDVNSVDGAEYLSGPTLANPGLPFIENPNFGSFSATYDPREIQIGVKYHW